MLNCLRLIGITMSFNAAPLKIVQRSQIAASWRSIAITISVSRRGLLGSKGSAKYLCFLANDLKKTTEYFLKFICLFESAILPVNNGKNFHSNGYLGWPVVYTIFRHIIDCVQLYFTNGFTNIVLYSINYLWFVGLILIFDGTPQIIMSNRRSEVAKRHQLCG